MSKRKLLLADDSITIQKVVNLTFADEGIEVIAVSDGDAAMEKLAEITPDLVMADVNMPGLNGYQVCEKIKQDEATKHIPVILLVGSFEPFDETEANRVGADGFLTKPFQSIRQLVNKVSALLDSKANEEDLVSPLEIPAAPDISFDDTLEISLPEKSASSSIDLGDAGMDDEMIQTAQIGSLPVDEARKFESKPVLESFAEDVDRTALKQPYNSPNSPEVEEDWAKTQPLTSKDFEEITAASPEEETVQPETNSYEFEGREEVAGDGAENDSVQIYPSGNKITEGFSPMMSEPEADFDDFDLLDFPPTEKRENLSVGDLSADFDDSIEERDLTDVMSDEQMEVSKAESQTGNLSPELIEAIADKVVEKLSNKVIRKIVREAVAQMEKRK